MAARKDGQMAASRADCWAATSAAEWAVHLACQMADLTVCLWVARKVEHSAEWMVAPTAAGWVYY